jgi:two-component system, cell cycle response regulator DivK
VTPVSEGGVRRPLVLLVEDDPVSLKLMRDVLRANGFETIDVGNGAEAVELAARRSPDVIVMDIGLPGLNGVEATRQIKASSATRSIPVVAVTAYAMPRDEERMREAGCNAYLTKPLRFADFVSTVRRLLRGTEAGAQSDDESGTEK